MESYCVKCRQKREMSNAKAIKLKNGRPAAQGYCPKCGTKMFRIGKDIPQGPDYPIMKMRRKH